jgi:hypothetical protein
MDTNAHESKTPDKTMPSEELVNQTKILPWSFRFVSIGGHSWFQCVLRFTRLDICFCQIHSRLLC